MRISASSLDVMAIARELAQFQAGDASLKVLFDWSEMDSWPFVAPSLTTVQSWKETVPPISRAAIVHDPKWTRHAALLAAAQTQRRRPTQFSVL